MIAMRLVGHDPEGPESYQTPWRVNRVRSAWNKDATRRHLATDGWRVIKQEIARAAVRIVGVSDSRSRRARVDLLLISTVQSLHPGIAAVGQSLHHLAAANSAGTASRTVTGGSTVWAKMAAVVQTALLPTDWARGASGAAAAIAPSTKFPEQAAATGIALLAAVVTASIVAQAPGSAAHRHRN
jgi:hypothetical protein